MTEAGTSEAVRDPKSRNNPEGCSADVHCAGRTSELVAALTAPSFQQDSQWHHDKAVYATKPRDLLTEAADKIEGLEADLQAAVEVAFRRGALDWTRLNYPKIYERMMSRHIESQDTGTRAAPAGCACPPTAEMSCQGAFCPRRPFTWTATS
jgi:hypothetical protein